MPTTMRGEPAEDVIEAEDQALRDTALLFELVLVINGEAEQAIREGNLRWGMLTWQMRALGPERRRSGRDDMDGSAPTGDDRWAEWRAGVVGLRSALHASDTAFRDLEARFLDGRIVLFPEAVERWETLWEAVEDPAAVVPIVAGGTAVADGDPDHSVETERILAWAKARALDLVGDPLGGAAIISNLFPPPQAMPPTP